MSGGLKASVIVGALWAVVAGLVGGLAAAWRAWPRTRPFNDTLPSPAPRQFQVTVQRADGHQRRYIRRGGSSWEHLVEAQQEAGLGGVVRVKPLQGPTS